VRQRAAVPSLLERLSPQPLVSVVAVPVATCVAGVVTLYGPAGHDTTGFKFLLLPLLAVAVAASYHYPVHIRHNLKLYLATVPLYVLAAAASPGVALLLAGAGVLGGELLARSHSGTLFSDIATSVARYAIVVSLTSTTIHGLPGPYPLRLLAGSAVYWMTDALTLPAVLSPISGEPPMAVVWAFVRGAGIGEAMQYVLGVLGALLLATYPWALALLLFPAFLVYSAFKDAREMHETTFQMLESMADAVDLRDPYTGGHSRRVAELTTRLLRCFDKRPGMPEADFVISAARVHDIGKIGLPDSVLLKEGRLSEEEQAIMQSHPEAGAQLLRRYREFAHGIEVVRHHHERWDGGGYPAGLRGHDIPFGARIVAVADSYDAMTSDRPYRRGMSLEAARDILLKGRGSQWDPAVVDAFMEVLDASLESRNAPEHASALGEPLAAPSPV